MSKFTRKAVLGAVAATVTVTAAFMTAGGAHAASARPAVPQAASAHAVRAVPAAHEAATALLWPLVEQGSSGERVIAIQYLLNARIGAGLAVDGVFGPATAAAVRSFQSRAGLAADGEVGTETWPALIVQVQQGSTGPAVQAVQHNLHFAYSFSSLAVDGVFGTQTQSAVQTFQGTFGLGVDGIVGPVTWNGLIVHEV